MTIRYTCPSCRSNIATPNHTFLKLSLDGIHYACCCTMCAKVTHVRLDYFTILDIPIPSLQKFYFN